MTEAFGKEFLESYRDGMLAEIRFPEVEGEDRSRLLDAGKEFDNTSKVGFGIDGDAETADQDFEAVRGTVAENKFTAGLGKEMEAIAEKASRLRDALSKI